MGRRKLSCIIALILCISVSMVGCKPKTSVTPVAGSSSSASEVTAPGTLPIVKNKITIKTFAVQNSQTMDLKTNLATIELEKRTNIHLDLTIVPDSALSEKKALLLASGDYPEIFLGGNFSNEEVMTYGPQQKIFQPLNKLIDKYAPEVKKSFAEIPNFKSDITTPDGNIYGLPQINEAYHTTLSRKMWINGAWLKKLNLAMPTTTDEFEKVLKAFKTQDPNGNGKADEIPLAGAIKSWYEEPQNFFMNAFIYDGINYFEVVNGKLDFAANKPEWREGLKYARKLYQEKLIDPASFTQSGDQLKQMGDNKNAVILGSYPAGHVAMAMTLTDLPANARLKDYVVVPPLKGPNGFQTTTTDKGITGAAFVITDKCKHPEAAIRLLDYMYTTDGTMLMEEGPKGTMWDDAKPGEKNILGEQAKWTDKTIVSQAQQAQNNSWLQTAPTKRTAAGFRNLWTVSQDALSAAGYEKRLYDATKNSYEGIQPKEYFSNVLFLQPGDVAEMSQLKTNITDYVNASEVQFITGTMDLDKDWDAYVKHLDALQLPKYIDTYGKAYTAKMKVK